MKNSITIFIAMLVFSWFTAIHAQEKSLKAEKNFTFNSKTSQLIINAERGQISLQSWDRDEVNVVLLLTARNKNTAIATKELEYVKFNMVKSRDNVFLNNKIVLPDSKKELTSIISAHYEIRVPKGSYVVINNRFGRVTLRNCSGIFNSNMQYTDLTLKDFTGSVNIRHSVGDINCVKSEMKGTLNIKHVNLNFQEISGKINIISDYGKVTADAGFAPFQLGITSHATELIFENNECGPMEINIDGSYCPLLINKTCYQKGKIVSNYNPDQEQEAWMLRYTSLENPSILKIKADFGSISLR